jgi:adenine-specific DNA-methyltransferase
VWRLNLLPRTEKRDKAFRNPDGDPRGPWKLGDISARNYYSKGTYPITTPSGGTIPGPPKGGYWRYSKEKLEELDADGRIWWGEDGNNVPAVKRYLSEVRPGLIPQTIWTHEQAGHNQVAKQELVRIMDFEDPSDVFITPKPVKLLQRILQIATDRDSIVLDSFAGSGTTAHAVLKQNVEDGGERKFVLVEMEDYANTLTAERVRRVVRGQGGQPFLGNETGFDFYELGGELFSPLGDRIDPQVDKEALGRFAFFLETGVTLDDRDAASFGANGTAFVGGGRDRDLYLFYEPGGSTVFRRKQLDAIMGREGAGRNGRPTIVYADRCAVDDEDLEASGAVFRKIPRDLRELMARFGKGKAR